MCKVYLVTPAPTLTPRGPNDGLPSFGPNKYYFMYIIYYLLFIIYYLLFIFIIYIYIYIYSL